MRNVSAQTRIGRDNDMATNSNTLFKAKLQHQIFDKKPGKLIPIEPNQMILGKDSQVTETVFKNVLAYTKT